MSSPRMASPGDASLRRRRDDADDAGAAPKKLKAASDDVGATSSEDALMLSGESLGENGAGEPEEEDDDDMELVATQPRAALPDDDDDDSAMDDVVEIPSTPPPVQLTAAALARRGLASPSARNDLRIDPTGASRATAARASLANGLVFRHAFPFISDKTRVFSPAQRDAFGQQWRVVWFPHGQSLSDEFVSVVVEMVLGDQGENGFSDSTTNGHQTAPLERHVVIEISLTQTRDAVERKYTEKSSVILFDKENTEFGIEKFVRRAQISNPSDSLLDVEGNVDLDVRLHFVNGDSADTETIDLDIDVEADPAVSPIDEDDLLGPTPVVTPTAAALTIGTPTTNDLLLHDSKKETGMVGLKNQGATCYMNSLLQTLFHLLAFRHVVYETPTQQEDTNDSVSLALQRVFYRLQTQTKAVSTKELTRSFGWSQIDSFMQHDVQELYRILCDRLEEKMKNTKVDNAIKRLFEGKVRSFVQCVNVDFQSFRDESFYDLQLDVKGCKTIYDSFRKYVEIEMLEGDNQYEAEGHGKQDAKKGVKFLHFPPVLNIQLKRFEYDPMRDGMVKIHDRFEFPKTLILDEFAPKQAQVNGSKQLVYHLHSVLVHSGDVHGGHYYVFIRPGKNIAKSDDWFRFDDDQITRADEQTAIEGNYGSGRVSIPADGSGPTTPLYGSLLSPETTPQDSADTAMDFQPISESLLDGEGDLPYNSNAPTSRNMMIPVRSFASAYMLVYVRDGENDIKTIQDVDEQKTDSESIESNGVASEDVDQCAPDVKIPEHLVQRFHEEEKASARRKKAQQTEHLFMTFRIASDTSISKLKKITKTVDFSSFGNNGGLRIRIKRAATIQQLYARIYKRTGVPVAQQRLWKVITRENRTHRPDTPIRTEMLSYRADSLIDDDASPKAPVRLYLQIVDEPAEDPNTPSIFRHFWSEFTPPEDEKQVDPANGDLVVGGQATEEEEEDLLEDNGGSDEVGQSPAPNLAKTEALLFIKFYDVTKKLGDRLEYMGNILFDTRQTGGHLATFLHNALNIPSSTELILYEEIQPISVSEIDMDLTLEAAEIQHGDIICYQLAEDESVAQRQSEEENSERYPDVPSYFQYLLDRVDVLFYEYGHPEKEPLILHLLFSNCYDEIIDALARQLGFAGEKRLYLRLYQHSPLNQLPKKNPLRHGRYAGDRQATLDDFLTEYSERTNAMYYEILTNPITEVESKKQVVVYLSVYDDCFVDSTSPTISRRLECLVSPSDSLHDIFNQLRRVFELDASVKLRACEVSHNGSLVLNVLKEDASLERFWTTTGYTTVHDVALFVEVIPDDELQELANRTDDEDEADSDNRLFHFGVVHFNFTMAGQHWIQPHGVPFVTYFREQDTVNTVKERVRRRIGISDETFSKWELAVVKDAKASTLRALFQDMEPEAVDNFTMSKFEEVCGSQFENISSLGLEHADTKSAAALKYPRRQEQGIKIRQS